MSAEKTEYRKVILNGQEVTYKLIRKKIKNMYLRVRDGQIIVSAGLRMSGKSADLFVTANSAYITEQMIVDNAGKAQENFTDGMTAVILGRARTIRFMTDPSCSANFEDDTVFIKVKDPENISGNEKAYKKALRAYTEALFTGLCRKYHIYFEPFGVPFPAITFRQMKTRWGSCRPQREAVTLNTSLIAAPVEAVEYVIVHEFAHFLHPDHSRDFYKEVARVLPDWQQRRRLLKNVRP